MINLIHNRAPATNKLRIFKTVANKKYWLLLAGSYISRYKSIPEAVKELSDNTHEFNCLNMSDSL